MAYKATDKQVGFALSLLRKRGYGTDWMGSEHKRFATLKERSCKVADWLSDMDRRRISEIIDVLKKETEAKE